MRNLFTGEIGIYEGKVKFCTTPTWIWNLINDYSDWDTSRHYEQMKEQIAAERLIRNMSIDSILYYV